MKKILAILTISAAAFVGCNKDDVDNSDTVNTTDRDFAVKAWQCNSFEIQTGQLAVIKSTDPAIVNFAQMIVTDHEAAKSQLETIAGELGIYIPNSPDSLDNEQVGLRAQLIDLDDRVFDSVYIHSQVSEHQKAIASFQTEISAGNNSRLKAHASSKLTQLQTHLQTAEGIADNY